MRLTLDDIYQGKTGRPGWEYELAPGEFLRLKRPVVALYREVRQAVAQTDADDPESGLIRAASLIFEGKLPAEDKLDITALSRALQDFLLAPGLMRNGPVF
jgi:hypothetical protein